MKRKVGDALIAAIEKENKKRKKKKASILNGLRPIYDEMEYDTGPPDDTAEYRMLDEDSLKSARDEPEYSTGPPDDTAGSHIFDGTSLRPIYDEMEYDQEDESTCPSSINEPAFLDVKFPQKRVPELLVPGKATKTKKSVAGLIVKTLDMLKTDGIIFGRINRRRQLGVYKSKKGYFKDCDSSEDSLAMIICKVAYKHKYEDIIYACSGAAFITRVTNFLLNTPNGVYVLDEPKRGYINFKNCVVECRTLLELEHSPEYKFTYYIKSNFRLDAQMNETSEAFFRRLAATDKDYISLLQLVALSLIGSDTFDRSAFVIGDPANGKSTLAKFIEKLLPDDECINLDFAHFADKHAKILLADARVSICHDIADVKISKDAIATFKNLVTHDPIMGRALYKDYTKVQPRCFFIFMGNDLPIFGDSSGAIQRRQWLIKTGPTVPPDQRNPMLLDRLYNDRVGIIATALRVVRDTGLLANPSAVFSHEESEFKRSDFEPDYDTAVLKWCRLHLKPAEDDMWPLPVSEIASNIKLGIDDRYSRQVTLTGLAKKLRDLYPDAVFKKKGGVSCMLGYEMINCNSYCKQETDS